MHSERSQIPTLTNAKYVLIDLYAFGLFKTKAGFMIWGAAYHQFLKSSKNVHSQKQKYKRVQNVHLFSNIFITKMGTNTEMFTSQKKFGESVLLKNSTQ